MEIELIGDTSYLHVMVELNVFSNSITNFLQNELKTYYRGELLPKYDIKKLAFNFYMNTVLISFRLKIDTISLG